jgi:hypothetical protein
MFLPYNTELLDLIPIISERDSEAVRELPRELMISWLGRRKHGRVLPLPVSLAGDAAFLLVAHSPYHPFTEDQLSLLSEVFDSFRPAPARA